MLFSVPRKSFFSAIPTASVATNAAVLLLTVPHAARAQNVFVSSYSDSNVQQFTSTGTSVGTFASNGLSGPAKLGFSPLNGDLYVVSVNNNSVVRYNGTTGATVQTITASLNNPSSIGFTSSGTLLVSNLGAGAISSYDGTTGALINASFISGINGPISLAVGATGDVFVGSNVNNTVTRYNGATGASLGTFASTNLNNPQGLAFGPDGNLYVANSNSNSITRYNGATGAYLDTFSSAGSLNVPRGIAFSSSGNLLVANYFAGNIIAITPSGTQSVFASIGPPIGIAIKNITSAAAPEPGSIALLALGMMGGLPVVSMIVRRRRKV